MLTSKEAAKYLDISDYWFRNLRQDLAGPKSTVLKTPRGPAYFYAVADLDSWASANKWRNRHRCRKGAL